MPSRTLGLLAALALICGAGLHAQVPTYPFRDYSMARDAELALVRTAAPSSIVDRATVRSVLPYYELRSTLGMAGKTPAQIADAVASAYATGALPKREGVSFAYMWSAEQHLGQASVIGARIRWCSPRTTRTRWLAEMRSEVRSRS
jgi:hypothetical protein